ncbi:unnamed protein product [Nippostrongylus brasiliensis]|uniref:DUF1758 domain-containing protein n=1 Tax=Nippostrongylus brasiliensis TaxID=27835 RepID=A0A0N4XWD5_NIPBR|nr:unnamed protein product [Nippostrongylus brasiliensis]
MDNLLSTLDMIISNEEKIAFFTTKSTTPQQQLPRREKPYKEQPLRGSFACMYCGAEHKATSCTKYSTAQERTNYLREHKLCFICASPQHTTSECKKRVCFACQGRHHTSCCFKATTPPDSSTSARQGKPFPTGRAKEKGKFTPKPNSTSTRAHQLSNQEQDIARTDEEEVPVAQLHSSASTPRARETYLPIGELTILNPSTRKLMKVAALLDSGAECSFIDQNMAEELSLPTLSTTTLRVRTFGSDRVQETMSRKVPLEIWDDKGEPCYLELLTHETLTSALKMPPLLEEDLQFIKTRNIQANLVQTQVPVKPRILLGSDQLWQLICHDQAHICLPSGLYLLPTRLGHLLTGQVHEARKGEKELRGKYYHTQTLEADINAFAIEDSTEGSEELKLADYYRSIENEAVDDFTQSERDRIVALALRFACRLVARVNAKRTHPIKLSTLFDGFVPGNTPVPDGREVELARKAIVKQHQRAWISPSITKSLKHLKLYEDEQGILRCRGRLGRSDLDEHTKFPMLILQKTWLSAMIIKNCHSDLHTSISHTMCRVRERYWIPKLRAETTKVIRRCTACQKMNNLPYKYPDQGQLPARRVTRSRPFEHIGLDYFGPLSVKGEETPEKCYGCIITCLATRLIHLDLVTDVSTVAFLHMLRRFFSRRGIPKSITSDNAPTFALGDAILSEMASTSPEYQFLARMWKREDLAWKNVENEMRKIRSDYSKESNKWTSTYYSWTELSSNTSTHPQACVMKFIVSEKLLRDCIVHRQVFARLAHQYITLGLVYQEEARQQSKATQEQLNNDVRGMMADFDDMLQKLEQTIAELEKVVHEKEATLRREPFREHVRPFFDSLWQSFENARRKDCEIQEKIYQLEDQVNAYKTQVAEFERHTKAHKEGQARLKQAIEKCNQDEREARQEVERLKTEVDSLKAEMARIRQQPDQGCEIEVGVSDEEHFIRMVEEVREAEPLELPADADDDQEEEMDLRSEDGSDDDAPEPEPAQPAQIEPQIEQDEDAEYARRETELRQRVDNLQNRITRMIADYYRFPFRKSEWESPGIHPDLRCLFCGEVGRHYSESCPRVTDGDERYFIIRNMGACDYCMEFCRGTCRYRFRRCFYCERVRGTMFEELMPEDNGHHSALCSIPGKKKRAKRMINDHEDALRRLLGELQRMVERRARAARGRGGPREGGAE